MTAPNAIEMHEVRLHRADWQVRYDTAIAAGAFIGLIGPSGGGKTTLLNLVAGFDRPSAGSVRLFGQDVTGVAPADRPVTTLFQEGNLFAHLSVADNVGLGRHPGLRLGPADRQAVTAALGRVGLGDKASRLPRALSGGERQRVALARALVRERPILLLDEPFAALDPGLRRDMVRLVRTLHDEQPLTVLMVTHQVEDLSDLDPRCLFIADGTIGADGRLSALAGRSDPPSLARYFRA